MTNRSQTVVSRVIRLAPVLLCWASLLPAQEIPAGTVLPMLLNSTIDAKKDKPGAKIEGVLKQDVPLPSGMKIKSGSHVEGHILEVSRPAGGGARVVFTFDKLQVAGHAKPMSLFVRAIAAKESVFNARLPINVNLDSSQDEWITQQVGGDIVNRGRGVVASTDAIVGKWDGAVWARLTPAPDAGCPASDGNGREQALWVFSTSACGVYGLTDLKLAHAGRTNQVGHIVLESPQDVKIAGGSGWLLLVNAAPASKP